MRLDSTNGRSDSNETPVRFIIFDDFKKVSNNNEMFQESAEAAQKLSQLQIEISNLLVEIERLGQVILNSESA